MKKTFTLFCALLGMSAMAQNVEYNFGDATLWADWQALADGASGKYTITGTDEPSTNGLTFFVGSEQKLYFQTNETSVMVGENADGEALLITPAYRFQLGGSAKFDLSSGKTLLGVPVTGACKIYVVVASGNSGEDRYLQAVYFDSSSEQKDLFEDDGYTAYKDPSAQSCMVEISYEGGSKDGNVYLGSKSSGINIFYILVSYDGATPSIGQVAGEDGDGGDAISSIKADGAVEIARYNVLGQKIEGEQKGVNIVKYSDGTTAKVLVK